MRQFIPNTGYPFRDSRSLLLRDYEGIETIPAFFIASDIMESRSLLLRDYEGIETRLEDNDFEFNYFCSLLLRDYEGIETIRLLSDWIILHFTFPALKRLRRD